MSTASWTQEELLEQARANANATIIATYVYLKQQGKQDEWIQGISEMFAPMWEQARGESALELARRVAFNPISLGGTLVSLEGNEREAIAVVEYPSEIADGFGISMEEVGSLYATVHQVVLESLDVHFAARIEGDRWTFTITS